VAVEARRPIAGHNSHVSVLLIQKAAALSDTAGGLLNPLRGAQHAVRSNMHVAGLGPATDSESAAVSLVADSLTAAVDLIATGMSNE
jgi:hypothetical protein